MQKEIIQNSRILIIDDQPENVLLLERTLRNAGYQHLATLTDSRKVLSTFTEFKPDLVATDLRMPYIDGFSLIKQLRMWVPAGTYIPVLVLTADNSRQAKQEALALGAKDLLTKPIDLAEALLRIYNLLETRWLHVELRKHTEELEEKVRARTKDLEQAQLEILQRLALAAEYRDDCTGQHTQRVGEQAALLARAINLPKDHVELIRRAAPLHDVGKIGIPDGILLKPGKLTSDEYSQIKLHTDIGKIILSGSSFPILQLAESIALYHHERWDGKGYYGLKETAIPLEARIVSIVDVFDVITHSRPYKPAQTIEAALHAIIQEREKQFDPRLVDVFLELQPATGLHQLNAAVGPAEAPRKIEDLVSQSELEKKPNRSPW
jgi:putative two-component system response regulator